MEQFHGSEGKGQGGTGRCHLHFLISSFSGGKQEREEGKPLYSVTQICLLNLERSGISRMETGAKE